MKTRIFFHSFLAAFFVLPVSYQNGNSLAQSDVPDTTYYCFGLIEDEIPPEIALLFDLSAYFKTKPREEYAKALEEFPDNKEEFYRVISEFPYLSQKQKKI